MKKALTTACAVTILVALSAQNAAGQGQRNGNGNSRNDAVAEPGEFLVQFKANANDAHKNKALAKIKGEELEKVKNAGAEGALDEGAKLFERITTDDQYVEFLTLPAYRQID